MAKKKQDEINKRFVFTSEEVDTIIEKQKQGFSLPRYMNPWFKGQTGVRRTGCVFGWTQHELDEYTKCKMDIHYFANNYCKIKSEDGLIKQMKLRDYQYKVLDVYTKNRFVINMSSRQTGKTITAAITILHYCLFNNDKGVMIVANKNDTVIEIIDKIKNIYKLLPFFLQRGIVNWNNKSIVFDNGCRIKSQARSKEPAIGFTIDLLYMDEFAHIPNTIVRSYYKAAVPTVSSIKNSKIIITSTPNGPNLFKDLVTGAEKPFGDPEKNQYTLVKVFWWQVPGRMDIKVYPYEGELYKRKLHIDTIIKNLGSLGYACEEEIETTDEGDRKLIRIKYINDEETDKEKIKSIKINGVTLAHLSHVTDWREQETKLIEGEENFNQEYGLQFISGAKRILNAKTNKILEERKKTYLHEPIEILEKRLNFETQEFLVDPDFDVSTRNNYYWFDSIDVSEGLGQDNSVIDFYRLMVRDTEWLKQNKIKTLYDAFYLKQTMIYAFNRLDPTELAELYYLTHFEWLNPDRVKTVLEYNGPGGSFLKSLPGVFESNNNFGTYVFMRFLHNQNDKVKKIGLKVSRSKKEKVKKYITAIESDKLYVDEEYSLMEMENFIKVETRSGDITYRADSGHDDRVMTKVNITEVFDTVEFKSRCEQYYNELEPYQRDAIDNAIDLIRNPLARSYKDMSNAIKSAKNMQKFGPRNKKW